MILNCLLLIVVTKILISKHKFMIYFRVVGLKGVQPRAADTTATVCTFFSEALMHFQLSVHPTLYT